MEGGEQFVDGEVVDAVALVGEPAGAISEAILEDQILPLFQQSRGTTPIEGVLEDDDVVCQQGVLFPSSMLKSGYSS